jgi:hypothetical protein
MRGGHVAQILPTPRDRGEDYGHAMIIARPAVVDVSDALRSVLADVSRRARTTC